MVSLEKKYSVLILLQRLAVVAYGCEEECNVLFGGWRV